MQKSKIPVILLSILIALGLWIYVVTVISPESDTSYTVPVRFQGEETLKERNLMLIPGPEQMVRVTLQGNRSDLNRLGDANVVATVDLSVIQSADDYNLNVNISVTDSNNGAANYTVLDKQPRTVAVTVVDYAQKEVPVELSYTGQLPTDSPLILDKESAVIGEPAVMLSGPADVIGVIDHADIEIDVTDLTQSIDENYRFTLVDAGGTPVDSSLITTNVAEINVKIPVEYWKEVKLVVQLTDGGGATTQNTKVKIEPESIIVSGSEAALSNVEDEIVLATINLAEQTGNTPIEFPIRVPETVTNRSGLSSAIVTLRFEGLLSKNIKISQFETVNVPEGYEAEVLTKLLEVTVRGKTETVSKLTASDLKAVIDCSDMKPGTETVQVTVTVTDVSVGVMNKPSVSVKLTEIVNENTGPTDET